MKSTWKLHQLWHCTKSYTNVIWQRLKRLFGDVYTISLSKGAKFMATSQMPISWKKASKSCSWQFPPFPLWKNLEPLMYLKEIKAPFPYRQSELYKKTKIKWDLNIKEGQTEDKGGCSCLSECETSVVD